MKQTNPHRRPRHARRLGLATAAAVGCVLGLGLLAAPGCASAGAKENAAALPQDNSPPPDQETLRQIQRERAAQRPNSGR